MTLSSERTRIERDFDPETVRQLKEQAGRDISVGGPDPALQSFRDRLVDEIQCSSPLSQWGGGKRALPGHVFLELELLDEYRFGSGVVHLHYRSS